MYILNYGGDKMEKVTAKEKYSYGIGAFGKDMV